VGLKDLFSSSGRSKNRLDRHMRAVVNQYGQSAERYHAMQELLEIGTLPAIVGLMRRFTMNSSKSIEDEEEKNWLSKRLTDLDKALMLSAAREFCLNNDNIAWVLRIVEDRANEREEWELFDALLEKHPPVYERDPSKKLQLLTHIAEIDNPRVGSILIKYLADPDETVRFQVVDSLLDIADEQKPDPVLQDVLTARLADPAEDSLRLRTKILTGLARLKWDLSAFRARIQPNLGNEHTFDGTRIKER
jgi:HEAT repeat protein